jgi:hypothetical protein
MTDDERAELRKAIDALVIATEQLRRDGSPEAFLRWHQCVDEVKRLHAPVVERALDRLRKAVQR